MSIFRSRHSAAVQPDFSGLAIQTATAAAPIPIVYGVTRVAPNIIWQNGVAAVPQYQSSGGSKGGGGKTVSGYEYYTWVMYAIGEGPITSVGTIYNGQGTYPYGSYGLSLLPGTTPQAPWGPAQANAAFAPAALPYNGTAYMASADFDLGSSAATPSLAFEVYGLLYPTAAINARDADPAFVVQDFLTNPQYGVGFPPASISAATLFGAGGDPSYQSYCKAVGLALSPALSDQETANSILARWLQLTNTAAIWSGGQLKFVPYGDTAVAATAVPTVGTYTVPAVLDSFLFVAPTQTVSVASAARFVADDGVTYAANGAALAAVTGVPGLGQYAVSAGTYTFSNADSNAQVTISYAASPITAFTPNTTPVYALTDDDFVTQEGQDPVEVARVDPYAVANVQRLECLDRSNQYAATPVEARDQNAIEQFGLRVGSTITAHEICDLGMGLIAAQLILQRGLYVRNTYGFKLSWECCLLEPMDVVTVTDPGLGLLATPVRITAIEEDADGMLAVTAEEFPGGVATVVPATAPVNAATPFNRNAAPSPVNPPVIVEPPAALTGGAPQLWAAVSGGANDVADPNWGGAIVWVSRDGTTFAQVGQVTAPARQGVASAALPAFRRGQPGHGKPGHGRHARRRPRRERRRAGLCHPHRRGEWGDAGGLGQGVAGLRHRDAHGSKPLRAGRPATRAVRLARGRARGRRAVRPARRGVVQVHAADRQASARNSPSSSSPSTSTAARCRTCRPARPIPSRRSAPGCSGRRPRPSPPARASTRGWPASRRRRPTITGWRRTPTPPRSTRDRRPTGRPRWRWRRVAPARRRRRRRAPTSARRRPAPTPTSPA